MEITIDQFQRHNVFEVGRSNGAIWLGLSFFTKDFDVLHSIRNDYIERPYV